MGPQGHSVRLKLATADRASEAVAVVDDVETGDASAWPVSPYALARLSAAIAGSVSAFTADPSSGGRVGGSILKHGSPPGCRPLASARARTDVTSTDWCPSM